MVLCRVSMRALGLQVEANEEMADLRSSSGVTF